MAFVNKKTFEIVDNCFEEEQEQYFECDELIAPTIRLLNLKGYKTEYCCQSHPYPEFYKGYVASDEKPELPFLDLYYLERTNIVPAETLKFFENELESGKKMFEYRLKTKSDCEYAYITFEEGCEPTTIPRGWKVIEKTERDMRVCITKGIPNTDEWEFFKARLETMRALNEWAEGLPIRK